MTATAFTILPTIKIGEEFHFKAVQAKIENCLAKRLQKDLHRLRDDGKVVFTGKVCIWKRIA